MSLNIPESYKGLAINTDSIKMIIDGNHKIYVFSIKLASKHATTFQNLTIDETENSTSAFITTYSPTKAWINAWRAGKPGKFDGGIIITPIKLGNEISSGLLNKTNTIKNKTLSSTAPLPSTMNMAQDCTDYTFYYSGAYVCASGLHWPGDPSCTLTGTEAAGYVTIISTHTVCTDDGGPGGGTTPNPDPDYDPCPEAPISFKGIKGERYASLPGPINPCDVVDSPPPSNDIIDNLTDLCLKAALSKAKNSSVQDTIEKIITKLDKDVHVLVSVTEQEQLFTNGIVVDGKTTNYNFDPNSKVFSCSIILNKEVLLNATQEYLVGTIVHEVLHAYLQYEAGSTAQHDNNHETIAKDYVAPVVNFLRTLFPDLDQPNATAIAWGGLQSTSLWKDSYKNDNFNVGTGTPISFGEMKGLETAHRNGYAVNSTPACSN